MKAITTWLVALACSEHVVALVCIKTPSPPLIYTSPENAPTTQSTAWERELNALEKSSPVEN